MVYIWVTGEEVGEGAIYSERNKKGEKAEVPLYRVRVSDEQGHKAEFAVTRDSSAILMPGLPGEAPDSLPGQPFEGRMREDGELGFRIELFELDQPNKYSLIGAGGAVRTNIQIHKGPGRSEGCFLLQGDEAGREEFRRVILGFIASDSAAGVKDPARICVEVLPKMRALSSLTSDERDAVV